MKKIYLLIGALVLALALLIGASVLIDKQLEKDTSFISNHIDFDKTAQNVSYTVPNASELSPYAMDKEVTEKVAKMDDISKISDNLSDIGDFTNSTGERADVVKDLLENVVEFCRQNPTMDEDSVVQLTGILETTINAFSALDDNVVSTHESSEAIHQSIADITELVEKINETLIKTEEQASVKL